MTLFATYFRRLGQSWRWLLVQLLLTPVLLLLGIAWTRIPEKSFLQVAATFLLPFLLIVSFLELEAGTQRALAANDGKRVKLVWGAVGLAVLGFLLWIGWGLVDTFDGQVFPWASYLNSQSPEHTRIFTYARYTRGLVAIENVAQFRLPHTPDETRLAALGVEGVRVTLLELASAYRRLELEMERTPSEAARVVEAGLRDSASFGMAGAAALGGVPVAGKTGTAEAAQGTPTHGWFVGLAPASRPRVVVAVYVPVGHGADAAAVAAAVLASSPLRSR